MSLRIRSNAPKSLYNNNRGDDGPEDEDEDEDDGDDKSLNLWKDFSLSFPIFPPLFSWECQEILNKFKLL